MIDINLPVSPVIYQRGGGQSCPMFIPKEGPRGSELGVKTPEPVAISQFFLKQFREYAGQEAARYLQQDAMPMAVRLAVIEAGTSSEDIEGWPDEPAQAPTMQTEDGRKGLAALYLMCLTKNLGYIRAAHTERLPVSTEQLQAIAVLCEQRGCLAGLFAAIAVGINQTTRRGASARKKQGDETRARIKQEAEPLRRRMSKEAAAVKVAQAVGKSTSTVRRLLTELYPSGAWRAET